MNPIRTRFAPSPTGRLHLGNMRTAVLNWLLTRKQGGAFVLRIEDTDLERNVQDSEQGVFEDLRWLGLEWDEGPEVGGAHGPYRQSERLDLYGDAAAGLMEKGLAYRCYCTDEELAQETTETSGGQVHHYSARCRELTPAERSAAEAEGRPWAVRFAVPAEIARVDIVDEIRGSVSFPVSDFDDFIILRRDGRPTYNFAVVVDDASMEITHVIRGVGHLSNTPKQALLFDAFEKPRPSFAHLPTVLAPGGGKLSKRTGSASVEDLRNAGYHPDGVVNYISLLGWSSSDEREVLSRKELIDEISLERIGASDTTYDPEKLKWMSGQHFQRMTIAELSEAAEPFVARAGFPLEGERLGAALEALRSRLTILGELESHLRAFFYPERAPEGEAFDGAAIAVVTAAEQKLRAVEEWSPETLNQCVRDLGPELEVKGAALYHPIRLALSGLESGPDIGLVMAAVGRTEVLSRLSRVSKSE